jgi:dolichol-phosphate mannosyltransferase
MRTRTRSRVSAPRSHVFRFAVVGALGIIVQIVALHVYTRVVGLHYLVATLAALETTLLHNFVWHRFWTWADRIGGGHYETLRMLARYNCSTGLVSAIGNLISMELLVERARLPILVANLVTIGICSGVNYVLADRVVFPRRNAAELAVA